MRTERTGTDPKYPSAQGQTRNSGWSVFCVGLSPFPASRFPHQARGDLERVNSLMTLEMRGVLTSLQWSQVQLQTANPNALVIVSPAPAAPGGLGLRGAGGLGAGGARGAAPVPAPVKQ